VSAAVQDALDWTPRPPDPTPAVLAAVHSDPRASHVESREVPLTRGFVALVDAADFESVMAAGHWYANPGRYTFYARRQLTRPNGTQRGLSLHRFLTGWPMVDHINGDGLDNRRSNLRPASIATNNRNARLRRDNTSGFKGVAWDRKGSSWRAYIRLDGRRHHLGFFATAKDAAFAYDRAAIDLHGEFGRLNFPVNPIPHIA